MADQPERLAMTVDNVEATETEVEEKTTESTEAEATVEATDGQENVESETEAPEYQPDYNYKVYDEPKEFPDWAKGLVKSKELEDEIRTILSKSGAFDPLKEKHEDRGSKLTDVNTKYDGMVSKLTEYDHYIKNGALAPVFKDWGISDQQAIDYVANLLKMQDASPEEKSYLESRQNNVVSDWQTTQQQQQLASENSALQKQAHEMGYQQILSQPTVVEFQGKLETVLGQGKFRQLADQYGQSYYQQHGQDTTPEDAVRHVMETYKNLTTMAPVGNDLASAQKGLEDGLPGGHLPRVGKAGGAASPVKKAIRSIDDLRKRIENNNFV